MMLLVCQFIYLIFFQNHLLKTGDMQYSVNGLFNNTVTNSGYTEHQMTERLVKRDRDFYESNSEIHNNNTRFSSDLHIPTANLTTFQKSPFYCRLKIYNHLPTSIKNTSHNINEFRSVLKSFLLVNSFPGRNILFGITIEILAQCNHLKSKHLNIFTCNITQYHSILLLLI